MARTAKAAARSQTAGKAAKSVASTKPRSKAAPVSHARATPAFLPEIYDRPGHLIRRAQQIAVAIFLEECGDLDLTPVQYAALVAVRDNPMADATRIAGIAALDRTTISGVFERLEAKELITRTPNKFDLRAKLLKITAAGNRLLKKAEPRVIAVQGRILAPLNKADRKQLMSLLSKLVDLNNEASRAPQRIAEDI